MTDSVHTATTWIVAALWGGYAAPNILKWHWWRLNGWGYFWGMIGGIAGALALLALPDVNPIWAFPFLFGLSLSGTIAGSLLTKPEEESVLVAFYVRTRPWGWWGPIHAAAMDLDPGFQANREFSRDAFNVVIGVLWQTTFIALPIYAVIRNWQAVAICVAIIVVTSTILKFTWYDRLESA